MRKLDFHTLLLTISQFSVTLLMCLRGRKTGFQSVLDSEAEFLTKRTCTRRFRSFYRTFGCFGDEIFILSPVPISFALSRPFIDVIQIDSALKLHFSTCDVVRYRIVSRAESKTLEPHFFSLSDPLLQHFPFNSKLTPNVLILIVLSEQVTIHLSS